MAWQEDWRLEIFEAASRDSAWFFLSLCHGKNEFRWAVEDYGLEQWWAHVLPATPPPLWRYGHRTVILTHLIMASQRQQRNTAQWCPLRPAQIQLLCESRNASLTIFGLLIMSAGGSMVQNSTAGEAAGKKCSFRQHRYTWVGEKFSLCEFRAPYKPLHTAQHLRYFLRRWPPDPSLTTKFSPCVTDPHTMSSVNWNTWLKIPKKYLNAPQSYILHDWIQYMLCTDGIGHGENQYIRNFPTSGRLLVEVRSRCLCSFTNYWYSALQTSIQEPGPSPFLANHRTKCWTRAGAHVLLYRAWWLGKINSTLVPQQSWWPWWAAQGSQKPHGISRHRIGGCSSDSSSQLSPDLLTHGSQ